MFAMGKTASPPSSFIIAANIVKSKVMQERAFASFTVACKLPTRESVYASDICRTTAEITERVQDFT